MEKNTFTKKNWQKGTNKKVNLRPKLDWHKIMWKGKKKGFFSLLTTSRRGFFYFEVVAVVVVVVVAVAVAVAVAVEVVVVIIVVATVVAVVSC